MGPGVEHFTRKPIKVIISHTESIMATKLIGRGFDSGAKCASDRESIHFPESRVSIEEFPYKKALILGCTSE